MAEQHRKPHRGHHHDQPEPAPDATPTEAAAPEWKVGQDVYADFDGVGEPVIATLIDTGHEVQGESGPETKFWVQNPNGGEREELGYREPGDRDAGGSGRTFWKL